MGGGGGVMNLLYGSSSSSYMGRKVFFGDECFHFRRSGVRLDQCSCVGAFVVGLIIFGSYFYGSTTFRMSTRRLPVLLFYFVCVPWHVGYLRLFHSLLLIILLPPPRGLSANLTARGYVKGYSVDCYCPDISYFHYHVS